MREEEDCPCEEEDDKEDDDCPREGSLPLDRWPVGKVALTKISQPAWRCREQRVDRLVVNTCGVEGASACTGDWK